MPYTTKELEDFVKDLNLPADKAKVVLDAIGADEKVLGRFGEHVLRQSDYSAKLDALKAEQAKFEKEYQARVAQEEKFHTDTALWKTAKEKEAQAAIEAAREEAEDKLTEVQARIKKLAEKNGIPDDEIKDLMSTSETHRTTDRTRQRDPETGKFLTIEDFNKQKQITENSFAKYVPIVGQLDRSYRKLFGEDAPDPDYEKMIDECRRTGKPLREVFDVTYKMSDKRKELDNVARKKEIEDAEKRGATQATSKLLAEHPEMSSRTVTRDRPGSAILDQARKHAADGKPPEPGRPQDAVSSAVNAFRAGKYKDGKEQAA